MLDNILRMTLAIFLIMNVTGHLPPIVALVKDFDLPRQRRILVREGFYAFLIATFYLFIGDWFLNTLQIKPYAMSLAGGAILLLVALQMIFPHPEEEVKTYEKKEPVIVPIATPMLSGGGVFTTVVVLSAQTGGDLLSVWLAIILCSIITIGILFLAPSMQHLIGKRGLIALEQLMGMLVVMMSIQMLVNGGSMLISTWR